MNGLSDYTRMVMRQVSPLRSILPSAASYLSDWSAAYNRSAKKRFDAMHGLLCCDRRDRIAGMGRVLQYYSKEKMQFFIDDLDEAARDIICGHIYRPLPDWTDRMDMIHAKALEDDKQWEWWNKAAGFDEETE